MPFLHTNATILPRQARDKHRERALKKRRVFLYIAINPETIGQPRVAEDYYKTHVAKDKAKEARGEVLGDGERTWGLSAAREWFIDARGRSHDEGEIIRYDRGSFNGIYTARPVHAETGEVEFLHDHRGFPGEFVHFLCTENDHFTKTGSGQT
jgi:hypothetical protein